MEEEQVCKTEIDYRGADSFREIEYERPGTLLNNCSYDLWKKRYVDNQNGRDVNPLLEAQPLNWVCASRWVFGSTFLREGASYFVAFPSDFGKPGAHPANSFKPLKHLLPRESCVTCERIQIFVSVWSSFEKQNY